MHVNVYVSLCVHGLYLCLCMWWPEDSLGSLLRNTTHPLLDRVSLLPAAYEAECLADQGASGTLLPLPPQPGIV